jgi:hypothetical protein
MNTIERVRRTETATEREHLAQEAAAEISDIYTLVADASDLVAPYGASTMDAALRVDRAIWRTGSAIERLDLGLDFIKWPRGQEPAKARRSLGPEFDPDEHPGRWPRFSPQEHSTFGQRLSEANTRLTSLHCRFANASGPRSDTAQAAAKAQRQLLRFRSLMDRFAFAECPGRATAEAAGWYFGEALS